MDVKNAALSHGLQIVTRQVAIFEMYLLIKQQEESLCQCFVINVRKPPRVQDVP